MRFDIHVHSTASRCSKLDIRQILEHAGRLGLDGVCITDHHTMKIREQLTEGVQQNGICVLFGMEYTTNNGDYLIFGPFEDLEKGLSDLRLLEAVSEKGGVAIAAHPFRLGRACRKSILCEPFCHGAEIFNGRNSSMENKLARRFVEKHRLGAFAGSDAHAVGELGRASTLFDFPVRGREDFIHAIKNHQYTTHSL